MTNTAVTELPDLMSCAFTNTASRQAIARNVLAGFHYFNKDTGRFFDSRVYGGYVGDRHHVCRYCGKVLRDGRPSYGPNIWLDAEGGRRCPDDDTPHRPFLDAAIFVVMSNRCDRFEHFNNRRHYYVVEVRADGRTIPHADYFAETGFFLDKRSADRFAAKLASWSCSRER